MMPRPNETQSPLIADATRGNVVDRFAPVAIRPYFKLARFDRPIGAWLLLFPCWWSLLLAELSRGHPHPNLWYALLFAIGAFVMRGAGCTWNDIVDRDFDAGVARTALRPIPSGQVSVKQALAFGIGLSLIGLLVLLQFNRFTILLGMSSLLLVAAYPFCKRFTYWPQLVLGLTFKWGALVGWTSVTGTIDVAPLALYAGSVLWTIGYDTIYAHQDKEDDATLGLKSTALRFGAQTPLWLSAFYAGSIALWLIAVLAAGGGVFATAAVIAAAGHFIWQIRSLNTDDPANCLALFKSNRQVGWLLTLGFGVDMMARAGGFIA
jgi:4-hydroxybenzoate polyprenyltransferase